MKKVTILFVILFVVLTSCSNNETASTAPTPVAAGVMTVNGVTTQLRHAFVVMPYTGNNPDYDKRRFYLVLTDGTLNMINNEIVYDSNIHQLIDFNLYSAADHLSTVQNTTYNLYVPNSGFDFNNPLIDHTSIDTSIAIQNGVYVSGDSLDSDDMEAGQITITQNNSGYTISFAFSNGGNNVSGNFTGNLTPLNYTY